MGYKTKHSAEITDFVRATSGKHFTVAEVSEHFRSRGTNISAATLYRQLDKLTSDGVLAKYTVDSAGSACYEYIGADECCRENCYHFKCSRCGRLIHLECEELNSMLGHLEAEHGFRLDPIRTVFYGTCGDCAVGG